MKVRAPARLPSPFLDLARGVETPAEEGVELRRTLAELKRELTQPTAHASP